MRLSSSPPRRARARRLARAAAPTLCCSFARVEAARALIRTADSTIDSVTSGAPPCRLCRAQTRLARAQWQRDGWLSGEVKQRQISHGIITEPEKIAEIHCLVLAVVAERLGQTGQCWRQKQIVLAEELASCPKDVTNPIHSA